MLKNYYNHFYQLTCKVDITPQDNSNQSYKKDYQSHFLVYIKHIEMKISVGNEAKQGKDEKQPKHSIDIHEITYRPVSLPFFRANIVRRTIKARNIMLVWIK